MGNHLKIQWAIEGSIFLSIALVGLLFVHTKSQAICFFILWGLTLSIAFFIHKPSDQLFARVMYVLAATTFLNQSVLNLPFGFFNLFLYRLVLILALFIFLAYAFKGKNLNVVRGRVKVEAIMLFFLFWLIYGAISLIWAKSFVEGIKYLFLLGTGVLFVYLATFAFNSFSRLVRFFEIWMGMSVILIVMGLINHFAHVQLPSSTLYGAAKYKLSYPTAVFFNQNDFATFLSITFFFYLSAAKNSRRNGVKISALVLSGFCIYIIYLTKSRASLLGVAVGIMVYGWVYLPVLYKKILACVGGLSIIGSGILFFHQIINHVQAFFQPSVDYMTSNSVRLDLLKNGLHFFLESYGFGIGAGNIPYYLTNEAIYPTNKVVEMHNWFMEILVNFGIFVFLGYVLIYSYLLIVLYKALKRVSNKQQRAIIEACLLGLTAFLISCISPSSVINLYFHWVFLSLAIATVNVVKMDRVKATLKKNLQIRQVYYGTNHSKAIENK